MKRRKEIARSALKETPCLGVFAGSVYGPAAAEAYGVKHGGDGDTEARRGDEEKK